jgi:hypothetical protein
MLKLKKWYLLHYAKKSEITKIWKKSLEKYFHKKKNGHKKVCPISKKNY